MRVEFCGSCGAPLEARWAEIVLVCRFCGCQNAPGKRGEPVPSSVPDDGRPRFSVGGRTYVVEGHLASGDSCEVYRGRWAQRLGELVVIKVLRALSDADLIRREESFLTRLHASSAQGASHFVTRLPQPIARGTLAGKDGLERGVLVLRWPAGFQHTLEDVAHEHPAGVDGRIAVWVLKRLLEILGFIHRSGVVHGAVTPAHVLVHPRDHGAQLVGFAAATAWSKTSQEPLPVVARAHRDHYPAEVVADRWVSPTTDVAMAARCALAVAGAAGFADAGRLDGALGRLVVAAAGGAHDDAWALRDEVDHAASDAYGPPRYNPIAMPGWSIRADA